MPYGSGEAFAFEEDGAGVKFQGPTDDILGSLYIEARQSLVTHGGARLLRSRKTARDS